MRSVVAFRDGCFDSLDVRECGAGGFFLVHQLSACSGELNTEAVAISFGGARAQLQGSGEGMIVLSSLYVREGLKSGSLLGFEVKKLHRRKSGRKN